MQEKAEQRKRSRPSKVGPAWLKAAASLCQSYVLFLRLWHPPQAKGGSPKVQKTSGHGSAPALATSGGGFGGRPPVSAGGSGGKPSTGGAGGRSEERKGVSWTTEEHKAFLRGLELYGKG
jgi:hypothetical protein